MVRNVRCGGVSCVYNGRFSCAAARAGAALMVAQATKQMAVPWPHDTVTAQTHARAAHWLLLWPCTQPHWRLMGAQATNTQ